MKTDINIMKYVFALVRNEILIHGTTETNMLGIMLSDKPVSSSAAHILEVECTEIGMASG